MFLNPALFPLLLAGDSAFNLTYILIGVVALVIIIGGIVLVKYFNLWLQAFFPRAEISIFQLIGMSLRKVNAAVIVRSKIMAVQASLQVTTQELEGHYLAGGNVPNVVRAMIAADRARLPLDFKTARAIDLASRDVLEAMIADSGIDLEALRADGGAAANNLLMQLQADLQGVPVQRPAITETTALGAAYLAGLAVGFWSGLEEIATQWKVDAEFVPVMSAERREVLYAGWQRAVKRAQHWIE